MSHLGRICRKRDGNTDAVLRERSWLAARPEAFRAALLRRATPATFARAQAVFHAEYAPGGVCGVTSVSCGISATTRDDGPTLGYVMGPGAWFWQGPQFTGGPRQLSFCAMEPSAAVLAPLAPLARWWRRTRRPLAASARWARPTWTPRSQRSQTF